MKAKRGPASLGRRSPGCEIVAGRKREPGRARHTFVCGTAGRHALHGQPVDACFGPIVEPVQAGVGLSCPSRRREWSAG
jgi:hypothetical protein